jgi:hypothetical protein
VFSTKFGVVMGENDACWHVRIPVVGERCAYAVTASLIILSGSFESVRPLV